MTHTSTEQPEALRFTKKPVTIVASQWLKSGDHPAVRDISDSDDLFFTGMGGATLVEREKFGVIGTLESPNHLVTPGDWIITGVQGEHYPCKPYIFEATYAPEMKLQQGKCLHQIDEPQAEALRLADKYEVEGFLQDHRFAKDHWCRQAAAELRLQHARIEDLEAQLSAIGAGGVEPLRKSAAAPAPNERAAFEAWLRVKPCGAAHDFGWEAWRARAALAATYHTQQGLELANCKGGKWLTVVYHDIQPGDESRTIGEHPKVSALSWSHALHDRDAALAAKAKQGERP